MIEQVLRDINNFFVKTLETKRIQIVSNKLIFNPKQSYQVGQYIYLSRSILNDGIHKITLVESDGITVESLQDEIGVFMVYALAVPPLIISIAQDIETKGNITSVESESLGDYSVSYGSGGSSWQNVYRKQLDPYRKAFLTLRGDRFYDCYNQ